MGELSRQSYPALSDEAAEHLAVLLQHRPDEAEVVVKVYPERCEKCGEIAQWSDDIAEIARARRG